MKIRILSGTLALVAACATAQSEQKSEVRTAQDRAQQALQQAADAQKAAAREQVKAEQMQQNVTQKQKELAQAQAQLRGQRAKAEQAQLDARQLTLEANREAQLQQQQAMESQQTESEQMRALNRQRTQDWTEERNLRGRVVRAGGKELQVRTSDQSLVQLEALDSTAVTLDGHTAKLDQIQPGSDVRASYQQVDGRATALNIDVTSQSQLPDSSSGSDDNANAKSLNANTNAMPSDNSQPAAPLK